MSHLLMDFLSRQYFLLSSLSQIYKYICIYTWRRNLISFAVLVPKLPLTSVRDLPEECLIIACRSWSYFCTPEQAEVSAQGGHWSPIRVWTQGHWKRSTKVWVYVDKKRRWSTQRGARQTGCGFCYTRAGKLEDFTLLIHVKLCLFVYLVWFVLTFQITEEWIFSFPPLFCHQTAVQIF